MTDPAPRDRVYHRHAIDGQRVVIESPLSGDFVRNYRYLLWCCRAVWLKDGLHAIGSHMLNPWFMDDTVPTERAAGIENPWVWGGEPHWFFEDLGFSRGMRLAADRCNAAISGGSPGPDWVAQRLCEYAPECWEAFERGDWPPHTPGFELSDD